MTTLKAKNPHAVAMGKLAGAVRTPAKAEASRINGRKGGRPPNKHKKIVRRTSWDF